MLKEQVVDLYCKWCPREQECDDSLTLEEKRGCLACGGFADGFLNLFKSLLGKLTVIDDEEKFVDYEVEYAKEHELHFPVAGEHRDTCNREAQLQHTKKQILDLMGE